jgi:hypothetical protein
MADATVIDLAAYRDLAAPRRTYRLPVAEQPGLALVLAAYPGAVAVLGNELELWLTPAQARALAADLIKLADEAAREGT